MQQSVPLQLHLPLIVGAVLLYLQAPSQADQAAAEVEKAAQHALHPHMLLRMLPVPKLLKHRLLPSARCHVSCCNCLMTCNRPIQVVLDGRRTAVGPVPQRQGMARLLPGACGSVVTMLQKR